MSEAGDRHGTPLTEVLAGAESERQETLVVPPWSPPRHEEAGFPQRPAWQPGPQGTGPQLTGPQFTGPQPTGPQQPWPGRTQPEWSDRPVVVRRADTFAGLLLLLAGFAAGTSLLVVWVHGGRSGMDLVHA